MNQIKQVVSVGFCVQRVFTQSQWATIAAQLKKWQNSVQQLLDNVNHLQTAQVPVK